MLVGISRQRGYRSLTPEEKGRLLDVLVELEASNGGFFLDKKELVPMTDDQIAARLEWSVLDWLHFRTRLVELGVLQVHASGGLYSKYMGHRADLDEDSASVTMAKWALTYWNSKKLKVHRETPQLLRKITAYFVKYGYTQEQLRDSIDNYAKIIQSPSEYYWTHVWALTEFLSRGVYRFSSQEDPFTLYRKFDGNKRCKPRAGASILSPAKPKDVDLDDL